MELQKENLRASLFLKILLLVKFISNGSILLLSIGYFLNTVFDHPFMTIRLAAIYTSIIIGLVFIIIAYLLSIYIYRNQLLPNSVDSRMVTVLHKLSSKIYLINIGLLILFLGCIYWDIPNIANKLIWVITFFTFLLSVDSPYQFAKLFGASFWINPILTIQMMIQSFIAGAAAIAIVGYFTPIGISWGYFVTVSLKIGIILQLFILIIQFTFPFLEWREQLNRIIQGQFTGVFWVGGILIGCLFPFLFNVFSEYVFLQFIFNWGILLGVFIFQSLWVDNVLELNQPTEL